MRAPIALGCIIILTLTVFSGVELALAESVTIVDNLGRSVTIDSYPPQRIVSLAPSNTEILFAIGAGPQVVGVDAYSDYPSEVAELPKVGGFGMISIETVISLNPDLILATGGVQLPYVEQLSALGYPVVALDPTDIDGVIDNVILVGTVTGNVEGANEVAQSMRSKISWVEDRVAAESNYTPRVYFELWHDPYMSFGPGTWVDEIITKAGGTNLFYDSVSTYPVVNSETIIDRNPEFIILQSHSSGGSSVEEVKARAGWNLLDAVQNNRIHIVDENLFLRPGPRITDGLFTLTSILHPEIFGESKPTSVAIALDLPIIHTPFATRMPFVEAGETLKCSGSIDPAINGSLIFTAYSGKGPDYDTVIRDIRVENGNYSFTWQLPSQQIWLELNVFVTFVPDDSSYATSTSNPTRITVLPPILMWWK
ncbi:MAG: cobalamin-binding protein [Candidatus Bathyarchaeota archaeon]